ncbi:metallophosphoesterase family protein [Candidatus Bathyarchaeota archaeon]|nr:metallophosphoesterase family protein [Candidatus Bathyarchaeota archaeon]
MKIVGLISDTHIPTRAKAIPEKALGALENSDLIIHAGDLIQLSVLDDLESLAPVVAVCGNMDQYDVKERLSNLDSVRVYNWKIGVIHDAGALWGTRKMKRIAKQNSFDALVFGHTHRPALKLENSVFFINPGSPTNPLPPFLVKPTIALLRITKEKIEPEIIQI